MRAAAGATLNPLTENESVTATGGNPDTHAEGHKQSTSLELTEVAPSSSSRRRQKDTSVHVQVKFCTHVGVEGVLVLLSFLVIAGLLGYITYVYTARFRNFQREFVWIFVVLVSMYFFAVLWLLKNWKHIAQEYTNRAIRGKQEQAQNALAELRAKTYINGPWFLWKLYILEVNESVMQIVNFFTVYLCFLPVAVSAIFGIALGMDSFARGFGIMQENTPIRRDRQIKVDIFMDFSTVAVPLLVIWFVYSLPISISDMVQITLIPVICLWMKLRSIFREIIRVKCVQKVTEAQNIIAGAMRRRRGSIYKLDETIAMAKQQQKSIPYKIRLGLVVYNVLYGIFLLVVVVVHFAKQAETGNECLPKNLWSSCLVKTPFCGKVFEPTCNCAVLDVQNHNWTKLPEPLYDMKALKRMKINHGPLNEVPKSFARTFENLVFLDLSYNALPRVDNLAHAPANIQTHQQTLQETQRQMLQ